MIKHVDDKWVLYTKDGSKVLGAHDTEAEAEAQERAIEASKHRAAELRYLAGTTGAVRTAMHNGREHLVVPVVALMEGVIHAINAPSAELVPLTTLSEKPERWNDRPVVLGHPTRGGRQCSANDPEIMASHAFGQVREAQIKGAKLICEAWVDPVRLETLGAQALLAKLRAGEMVDVSVGAFVSTTDEAGDWYGKKFAATWMQIQPDHLAFLPHTSGACSLEMGCGANRAAELATLGGPGSGWTAEGGHVPGAQAAPVVVRGPKGRATIYPKDAEFAVQFHPTGGGRPRLTKYTSREAAIDSANRLIGRGPTVAEADSEENMNPRSLKERLLALFNSLTDAIKEEVVDEPKALAKTTDCPTCNGSGNVDGNPCEVCDGEGELKAAAGARNSASDLAKIQTMHDHSVDLGAACSFANIKALETAAVTEAVVPEVEQSTAAESGEESGMKTEDRAAAIKALTECPCSGFDATHLKMLEAASDEQLVAFAERGKQIKADGIALKAAQDKATEDAAKITALEAAAIPEAELTSLRALAADKAKVDEAHKAELVAALKTAQSVYDEKRLGEMTISQLEDVSKLVKVEVKDYSGRGVVRQAADHQYAPPDAYAEGLKALQTSHGQTAKAN